jgi:3-oxoacyl-(acyl-carrier-protein) synthase
LENPPPVPGLEFIREARGRGGGKVVLKNSFGFGGQNGCVVLAGC